MNVTIKREEIFNGRSVNNPWTWLYSLDGETPNYKGTPLASLRQIAKRIARQRNVAVVEAWKRN